MQEEKSSIFLEKPKMKDLFTHRQNTVDNIPSNPPPFQPTYPLSDIPSFLKSSLTEKAVGNFILRESSLSSLNALKKSYPSISRTSSGLNLNNISFEGVNGRPLVNEVNEKNESQNSLLIALKKSLYCNSTLTGEIDYFGDKELLELINNNSLNCNPVLKNELNRQESLFKKEEEKPKRNSSFSLFNFSGDNSGTKIFRDFFSCGIMRIKKLSKKEQQKAIDRYLNKKQRRKKRDFIRYQVRKDLAVKRKRHRGKFMKHEKVDLKRAAELFMQGELSKRISELKVSGD